jgi:hypothetical protein
MPSARPTQASSKAEQAGGESVTRAPKTVEGKSLLSTASRTGNATLPLAGGLKEGTLGLQVNCQGKGTLTVSLEPSGVSFPLECVPQEVTSTYNQVRLKRARGEATLQINAPSTVRWALTVEQ